MTQEEGSKSKPKQIHTEEFRRSVVDHLLNSGDKSIAQVAREFGITAVKLRVWKMRYGPAANPVDAPVPQSAEELARQNQTLRKELARVITQRDILKKTIVIVLEQSNRDIT
jgi:transposase-like protein